MHYKQVIQDYEGMQGCYEEIHPLSSFLEQSPDRTTRNMMSAGGHLKNSSTCLQMIILLKECEKANGYYRKRGC